MQAQTIERRFKANRVFINNQVRMGNYTRFDLWCGLIVNVYDTGSVVVQGRIRAFPYPYDPLPGDSQEFALRHRLAVLSRQEITQLPHGGLMVATPTVQFFHVGAGIIGKLPG